MRIETINFYVADDGTRFENQYECAEYEQKQKEAKSLLRAARRIREICSANTEADEDCSNCPFNRTNCPFRGVRYPRYWNFD